MPAAAAVVAIGLVAPLMAQRTARPPGLSAALAEERLERFLESRDVWPRGDVVVPRPQIAWKAQPRATTYAVSLHQGEGPAIASTETDGTTFRPAGDLAPGAYRVRVVGRDVAGEDVGAWEGSFSIVDALPRGDVSAARPAFHWRPVPGAARYRVRLLRGERQVVLERSATAPFAVLRPPGVIQPGAYHLEVTALGADGRTLGKREADFRVPPRVGEERPDEASEMRMVLDPAESALVLAGRYASAESVPDLVSALEGYLDARRGQADPLVLRVLSHCGVR